MMRIQILPLPAVVVGDDVEEPFALVVDQWPHDLYQRSPHERTVDEEAWGSFAANIGARGIIATQETVEIVDRHAELEKPKTDLQVTRISLPEDFDAEKVQRELRFAFGLCRDCGKSPCVCLRSAPCPELSHEIEHDAHEWEAPVDGHVHCPGWPPVADSDEWQR